MYNKLKNNIITITIMILVGVFLQPQLGYGAACNDQANGNWNASGTWTSCGGGTPGAGDTVTIDGFTVTMTQDESVHDVTIGASGTLNAVTNTLFVSGSWSNSGTFTGAGSSVVFTSTTSETITSGGDAFGSVLINDGLVGYWKLESSVSTAYDYSGYGNDGTVVGGVSGLTPSETIKFANAGAIDVAGDQDYVRLPDDMSIISGVSGVTYSAWVKNDNTGASASVVLGISENGSNNSRAELSFIATGEIRMGGRASDSDSFHSATSSTTPITQNKWHHVAGVIDYANDDIYVYVDGEVVASTTSAGFDQTTTASTTSNSSNIGIDEGEVISDFHGGIDDVRVYNRVLSFDEIRRLAAGNGPGLAVGEYVLQDALNIDGTLSIHSGTLDVGGSNYQINVEGDWENTGGVFEEQSGTVVFDKTSGGIQEIAFGETFYGFEKEVTTSGTLLFGQKSTTTITNDMILKGASGQLLLIRSSTDGTQAMIDPQGTSDAEYLHVKDNANINSTSVGATNSTDGGNVENWFTVPADDIQNAYVFQETDQVITASSGVFEDVGGTKISSPTLFSKDIQDGDTVLLIADIWFQGESNNDSTSVRIADTSGTAIANTTMRSEMRDPPDRAKHTRIMTRTTKPTGEGFVIQTAWHNNINAYVYKAAMTVINLEDLVENTDYVYGENTGTTAISASGTGFETWATITTPSNFLWKGDVLVMDHFSAEVDDTANGTLRHGIQRDSDGEVNLTAQEGENNDEVIGGGSIYIFNNADTDAHTYNVRLTNEANDATDFDHVYSSIIAFRASLFEDFEYSSTDAAVANSGADTYTEAAAITPFTPTRDYNYFIAGFVGSDGNGTGNSDDMRMRIQLDGASIPSGYAEGVSSHGLHVEDSSDVMPLNMSIVTELDENSTDLDLDATGEDGTNLQFSHRNLVAFSFKKRTVTTISGSSDLADSTIANVAVNSVRQAESGFISSSAWSISVTGTLASGDIVTVWAEDSDGDIATASEATGVTRYDGSGDVTNMVLDANVLSIGSSDNQTVVADDLSYYDNSDDEDIMHEASTTGSLNVDVEGVYSAHDLDILANNVFVVNGTQTLYAHDVDIASSATLMVSGTAIVSGSWTNAGTFTGAGSTVMLTGTMSETLTSGGSSFDNLIINDGLVAYWKLDEGASPAIDSSGYGNHGTWNNDPALITTVSETISFANPGAAEFDGGDDFIEVEDTDTLNITGSMSVSLWFRLTAAATEFDGLIMKSTNNNWPDGYGIYFTDDAFAGGSNAIVYFAGTWDGPAGFGAAGYIAFDYSSNTSWHHVVGVFNGSDAKIYLDGTKGTDDSYTGGVLEVNQTLKIGKGEDAGAALNGHTVPAEIDDVRIYNRALTAEEVALLAAGTGPGAALGEYVLQDALDVDGTLSIHTGTLDVSGSNRQINVGGNWENTGGVFEEQSGAVVFDQTSGGIQEVTFSETFYNFDKQVSTTGTLIFGQKSTTVITNTATIKGASGQLLLIRSSLEGSQAKIDPQGTRDVDFLDVKDNNNINATIIVPDNSVNTGNTTNWFGTGLSGSSNLADSTVVAVAINSTRQSRSGTVSSNAWSFSLDSILTTGDIVTIWAEDADGDIDTANESTGVTKFDGSGDIISMVLDANVLSIGSSDNQTVVADDLSYYDNSDDEDIMHEASTTGSLNIDIDDVYAADDLDILFGNVFVVNGTQTLYAHDVDIASGSTLMVSGTAQVSGSWTNAGTFTGGGSTVVLTGTMSETLTSGGDSFDNLMINDGLIAYWKMDEAASPSIDYSGHGNHAIWSGSPTFSTTVSGTVNFANPGSLDFDGSSDYLNAGTGIDLANKSFTLVALVKRGSTGTDDYIFGGPFSANYRGLHFGYRSSDVFTCAFFGDDLNSLGTYAETDWRHWACTYDATTNARILYRDGVLENNNTATEDYQGKGELLIGDRIIASSEFDGLLDELRIYNRVLSADEILRLASGHGSSSALGEYVLQDALDVDGTLSIHSGTLDVSGSNRQINVGGNWENAGGVFEEQSGTVVFDQTSGGIQEITFSETFYGFDKQVSTTGTLIFGASSKTVITNTMILKGASGQLLLIRSSTDGSQAKIDPQGTRDVDFLDVKDNNNVNATKILPDNSTNTGNTVNWFGGVKKGAIIIVE